MEFGDELIGVIAQGSLEIAILFVVSKFFWLTEDDEEKMKRLEDTVELLTNSMATGLANSYFFNFVLPVCDHLLLASESKDGTPIDLEIARGQFESTTLHDRHLYVLLPRDLHAGADIKGVLREGSSSKLLGQGRPKARPEADAHHRPMFLYIIGSEEDHSRHLIDIPTIVSSIRDRFELNERLKQEDPKRFVPTINIAHELITFANVLLTLIATHQRTRELVRVLMVRFCRSIKTIHSFFS